MLDPRSTFDNVMNAAAMHLVGDPDLSVEEQLALASAATPADVQDLARGALSTALLGVPAEAKPDLGDLTDLTEHEPPSDQGVTGQVFGRKPFCLAPRDLRAVVGDDGISLTARSTTTSATWDQVVGVAAGAGDRVIVLRNGLMLSMCDKHLRDTRRLFALIDERAGDKVFTAPDDAFH